MFRIAKGEKLLIKQTLEVLQIPWGYRVIDVENNVVIKTDNSLTSKLEVIDIDNDFDAFSGKTVLLEIFDDNFIVFEDDLFLLGGLFEKFLELCVVLGLQGENIINKSTDDDIDFQEGHELFRDIRIYSDNTLSTEIASFEFTREFVKDFTPDFRFHLNKEIQKRIT